MRLINFDPAVHNPKRVPLYTSDGFRVRVLRAARWIDRNYYACLVTVKDGSEMEGFYTDNGVSLSGRRILMVDISVARPVIDWSKIPQQFNRISIDHEKIVMHNLDEVPTQWTPIQEGVYEYAPIEAYPKGFRKTHANRLKEHSLQERP